jgi:hypothetical protein
MKFRTISIITALLFTAFTFYACGTGHDHGDVPVGFAISLDGDDLVVQDSGTLTYMTGDAIEIPEETIVGPLLIEFISEDGERYQPDAGEYGLMYSVSNTSVITIEHPAGGSEWQFNVTGMQEGETTAAFELWHGDHSDFESLPINFRVFSMEDSPS